MSPHALARCSRGQAQVELVAGLPLTVAVAAVVLQLFAVGYAQSVADAAALAGATALIRGEDPSAAAEAAAPGWAGGRIRVTDSTSRIRVRLAPPAIIPLLSRMLEVESTAAGRPPGGQ